jgi:uncharacterized repeat protein (TIGR01451 family)
MFKFLIIFLMFMNIADARVGKEPPSQRYNILNKSQMESYSLQPVNIQELLKKYEPKDYEAKPYKFATPNTTLITPESHGIWTNVPGGKIWNLRFESKNATDINFGFTKFHLPKGVELYLLSFADDPIYYDGPYTSNDNQDYKQFWTAPLPGGDVAIELFIPDNQKATVELELTKVSTGFRDVFQRYNGTGLNSPKQGACNNDVVCPVGDPWRDEIRSVAAYTMAGVDFCSGTMVMDAESSFKPYFLTAAHCNVNAGNASTMVTIWNYESINCGDLSGGSRADTVSGSIFRARRVDVDMGLVELSSTPPESFGVYWAGWDSSGIVPNGSVGIHHPGVEEKAISFNDDPLTTVNGCIAGTGTNTHWEVDNWEDGTTEPGSSGSGIWDPDTHLVVGFLSGGAASCGNPGGLDCYGKFSVAWDDGSGDAFNLKPWLDPNNTGITSIAGSDPSPISLTLDSASIEVCNGDNGVGSTVNVVTLGGFTNMVSLSAPNSPAFLSGLTFANNPINPTPGSSSFTFDVGAGGTTGANLLTIQGDGMDGGIPVTASTDLSVLYSGGVTTATTLTTPADNAQNVPINATFTWDTEINATSYRLMVSPTPAFFPLIVDETLTTTTFNATGLPSNIQLFWKVVTQSACNTTDAESSVFRFTTIPLPGDCAGSTSPVIVESYDFESGAQGWVSGTNQGADTWVLSTNNPTPFGSTQHWHVDDQASTSDTFLTSPIISLPIDKSPLSFQFNNAQQLESRTAGGCWDGGILEISVDGGAFTQVDNSLLGTDPYDGALNDGPLNGSQAWCGDPQDYLNSIVDINANAGNDVQFRFRVSTDGSVGNPGWDIDDIKVQGCELSGNPEISVTKTAILTTDNGQVGEADLDDVITFSVSVENTGNVELTTLDVTDTMVIGSLTCTPTTLQPTEMATCTDYTYTVVQLDIDTGGTIDNTANVTMKDFAGNDIIGAASTQTVINQALFKDGFE